MRECSCPSQQFVCHAAHGCVCKSGFTGMDCLTPKSQSQQLGGTFYKLIVHNVPSSLKRFAFVLFYFVFFRSK